MANRPFLTQDIGWDDPLKNIMQELGQFAVGVSGMAPRLAQMQQQAIKQQQLQEDMGMLSQALKPERMPPGQERLKALEQGKSPMPDKQGKVKTRPQSIEQSLLNIMGKMQTREGIGQAFQMYNQAIKNRQPSGTETMDYYVRDESGNWVGRSLRVPAGSYNKAQQKIINQFGEENVSFGAKPELTKTGEKWSEPYQGPGGQFLQKNLNTGQIRKAYKKPTPEEAEPAMKINQWYNEASPYLQQFYGTVKEGGFNVNPSKVKEYRLANKYLEQYAKNHQNIGPLEAANLAMDKAKRDLGKAGVRTEMKKRPSQDQTMISSKIVEKAIGPESTVKQWINNTLGAAKKGQIFPDVEKSRNKVRAFNQAIRPLLTVSSRGAKFDVENINKYLPNPDKFFQDPDAAADILINLNEVLGTSIATKRDILENKSLPTSEAERLLEDINRLETAKSYIPDKESIKFEVKNVGKEQEEISLTEIMNMDTETLKNIDLDSLNAAQTRAVRTRAQQLIKKQKGAK